MKRYSYFLTLCFALFLSAFAQSQEEIIGVWHGYAELNGMKMRVVFGIEGSDESLNAYMESPDQGSGQMPASSVSYRSPELELQVSSIGLVLKASYQPETDKLSGKMIQAGMEFPVELGRESLETAIRRPQEPIPPLPYYNKDIRFFNEKAGIWLSGTISLPEENAACPVAVLISGSGPQDRNEEIMNHKPFLVIADHLARNGIGTLRFDDRGVAESEGDFGAATSKDFASDVMAGVNYLEQHTKASDVGLIGHSEGGMICALVAADNPAIDFVISLAGTAVPGITLLVTQNVDIMLAEGMPQNEAERQAELVNALCQTVLNEPDSAKAAENLKAEITRLFTEEERTVRGGTEVMFEQYNAMLNTDWMRFFLNYDPASDWARVKCPVLAMNGSKDTQVALQLNFDPLQRALIAAGNEDFTLTPLRDHNHLFQRSTTGAISEYGKLEESFSIQALQLMSNWISKRFK